MELNSKNILILNVILFFLAAISNSHWIISIIMMGMSAYLLYNETIYKNEFIATFIFWLLIFLNLKMYIKKENMSNINKMNCNVHHIKIFDSHPGYHPQTINIKKGDIISWTNVGTTIHSVTSNNINFNSGDLHPGETFDIKFMEYGKYPYYCKYNKGWMMGEVNVL